jgi:hypothetical protein
MDHRISGTQNSNSIHSTALLSLQLRRFAVSIIKKNVRPSLTQVVKHRRLIVEAQVHSQASPCCLCGENISVSFHQYTIFIHLPPSLCNRSSFLNNKSHTLEGNMSKDKFTCSVNLTFCSPCILVIDNINQPTTALIKIYLTLYCPTYVSVTG